MIAEFALNWGWTTKMNDELRALHLSDAAAGGGGQSEEPPVEFHQSSYEDVFFMADRSLLRMR